MYKKQNTFVSSRVLELGRKLNIWHALENFEQLWGVNSNSNLFQYIVSNRRGRVADSRLRVWRDIKRLDDKEKKSKRRSKQRCCWLRIRSQTNQLSTQHCKRFAVARAGKWFQAREWNKWQDTSEGKLLFRRWRSDSGRWRIDLRRWRTSRWWNDRVPVRQVIDISSQSKKILTLRLTNWNLRN